MSENTANTIVKAKDLLAYSRPIWNSATGVETTGATDLRNPEHNILASYDYNVEQLTMGGEPTRFSMLKTSDEGLPVGIPFDPNSYKALLNDGFITVIESLCDALAKLGISYTIATSGTLRNRGRVFIALELGDMSKFNVGGREFYSFLNCLNSVDKSCSVTFSNNTFCVCCANTFSSALKGESGAQFHAKVKHTDSMMNALGDVPKLVDLWVTGNEAIFATLNAFDSIGCTAEQAEAAFATFIAGGDVSAILKVRSMGIIDKLVSLFNRGKGNKGETLLDLFSGATEYFTHQSAGKTEDPWKQIETSEVGDGSKRKSMFFDLLSEMADSTDKFNGVAKVGQHIMIASRKAQHEAKVAKAS